jgi:hypothetical protein
MELHLETTYDFPLEVPMGLPVDILRQISMVTPEVYFAMVQTCKAIAINIDIAMSLFTKEKTYGSQFIEFKITWALPDGEYHSPDIMTPSTVTPQGKEIWHRHGVKHRGNDLPAVVKPNGDLEWYCGGIRHRDRGPAVVKANGRQEWYHHGKRHRDGDRPAIAAPRIQEWWFHGMRHRSSGPAVVKKNTNEWWVYGIKQDH